MQKTITRAIALTITIIAALSLAACGRSAPDPHEGMIYVNTGPGHEWLYPEEGVPVSAFAAADFMTDGNIITYAGEAYDTMLGVDVSFYQGEIDWQSVKDSGVEFAMIRCGYRGATEGELFEDDMFRQNIEGALGVGLPVGVYFFSQSIGAVEAAEEAQFVIGLIADYDITMPVAFDWEPLDNTRTDNIDEDTLTSSAIVFCEMIRDAGYEPSVYFYRNLAYFQYDLTRLKDYNFWVGAPGDAPDFYYSHDMWQYSFTGRVDGIEGDVDLNLYFEEVSLETEE